MKRKSGRKNAKPEEESTNGVTDDEQNGENLENEPDEKKRRSGKGRKSKKEADSECDAGSEDEDSNKNKKKNKGKVEHQEEEEDGEDCEYEVEAILDHKMVKNVLHYLIRWKGYTEESDTWEPEHTLECAELIADYNKSKKDNKSKRGRKKKDQTVKEQKKWDESQDFEVDRIIDVYFKRDGKREFLVSWKGYPTSENTWEPEENMDCKDMIARFMARVDKAKNVETKELRPNRRQVQRLQLYMHEGHGRRLSKRNRGKERVQYMDTE